MNHIKREVKLAIYGKHLVYTKAWTNTKPFSCLKHILMYFYTKKFSLSVFGVFGHIL